MTDQTTANPNGDDRDYDNPTFENQVRAWFSAELADSGSTPDFWSTVQPEIANITPDRPAPSARLIKFARSGPARTLAIAAAFVVVAFVAVGVIGAGLLNYGGSDDSSSGSTAARAVTSAGTAATAAPAAAALATSRPGSPGTAGVPGITGAPGVPGSPGGAAATAAPASGGASAAATAAPAAGAAWIGIPLPLPVADSTFENYGVNPYIVTSEERFSTFAMDVDTASYTITRGYLQRDVLPPRDAIRVEEFVNYFDQGYAPSEEVFTIELDGARSPYRDDGRHLLRIGIQGKDITFEERKDAVITFVIDTSGSMAIDSRIGLAKRALLTLVDNLHTGDRVGIVEYGSTARTLLEPTDDKAAIRMAISRLSAGGSTNAEAGLLQGYEMATAAFEEGKINRVVLVSDGVANVGETGPDAILAKIKEFSNDGITLSAIGVGFQNYNDVLLERLADNGDGNYVYLDNDDEATELFGSGLTGLLEVIASDAKIQVEFNPDTVRQYRLIGYENRALTTEQFRDDTVDAGEVGAGHSVTALYELVLVEGAPEGTIADVRVRYADPESGDVAEISSVVVTSEIDRAIGEASPRFRFSAAVTEFAEILRESPWAHDGSLGAVLAEAQEAVSLMDATPRDRGFIDLVQRAIQLSDG